MSEFLQQLREVAVPAREYVAVATRAVARLCAPDGRADPGLMNKHQRALHGLAWISTTAEAIACAARWGMRLNDRNRLGAGEELALTLGIGEYDAKQGQVQ